MSRKIHVLRGVLDLDYKGFVAGIRKGINATKEFRESWSKAGRDVAKAATRLTLATALFTGVAIKQFSEFESVMVRVRGVTNTLGAQGEAAFKRLTDAARNAGATTRFTATQSAEAMEKLALAGLRVNEVMTALPGALQLASAAQVDIATAADVAAKTMRSFGMQAEELSHINDVLVATFTRANTDLLQLAEAIKPVGPVAASLGVSLETTTAVIAKLSDAGLQASEAGTQFRNILKVLAGAVPETTVKLKKMGLSTIYAADGSLDLVANLRQLQRAGLTTGEVLQLFGIRGGPGLSVLLQQGIDSLVEFEKGTRRLGGIAKKLEQAQLDTLAGQFDLLKSAVAEVVLQIGEKLAPTTRELVNEFKRFVEKEGPRIAETFVEAAKALADFGKSIIRWLMDNRDTVQDFVDTLFGIVKWMAKFAAEHPKLMSMLAALKITGILGVNQAVASLLIALKETIKLMGLMAVSTRTLSATLGLQGFVGQLRLVGLNLKVMSTNMSFASGAAAKFAVAQRGAALAASNLFKAVAMLPPLFQVALVVAIGYAIKKGWDWITMSQTWRDNMRQLAEADRKLSDMMIANSEDRIRQLKREAGENSRLLIKKLEEQRRIEGQNVIGIDNAIKKAEATLAAMSTGIFTRTKEQEQLLIDAGLSASEGAATAAAKRKREELQQEIEQNKERLKKLGELTIKIDKDISDARRSMAEEQANLEKKAEQDRHDLKMSNLQKETALLMGGGEDMGIPGDGGGDLGGIGAGGGDLGGGQAAGDRLSEKEQERADLAQKIGEVIRQKQREGLAGGTGEISELLTLLRDAILKGAITQDQAFGAIGQFGMATGATSDQSASLASEFFAAGQAGQLTPENIQQIAARFAEAVENMKQSAESLKERTQIAKDETAGLAERFAQLRQEFPNIELNEIAKRFLDLRKQFIDGRLTQEQFANAMRMVKKETDAAVKAAKEKEIQERRERMLRLLSGKGTRDDIEWMNRLRNAKSMEIFDQQLQKAFEAFAGLNDQVEQAAGEFSQLNQTMSNFQNNFVGPGSQFEMGFDSSMSGSAGDQAAMMDALNSPSGMLAAMYAELQTLNNGLLFAGPNGRRTQEIQQQIAAVESQIQQLLNPVPQFVGTSGDIAFEDPGLAGEGGGLQNGRSPSLTINAPNLTRFTNQDAREMALRVQEVWKRQGTTR